MTMLSDRVHPKTVAYSRFHCGACGQPVDPAGWLRLSYRYRDCEAAYLACPTCLATQTLIPLRRADEGAPQPPPARRIA